jgi:alkanesulfonate monooxygenase SsuD/methylene tetrahydromethanopterin reductase-like flavin-dependent oxidoreductase (luciferase family)
MAAVPLFSAVPGQIICGWLKSGAQRADDFRRPRRRKDSMMRIGYTHDFRNSTGRPWKDVWEDALLLMCEAARLGFDYVLVQEHHFTLDGYSPSPAVFMSTLIERTTDVRIGTNSYVLPLHHPAALAQEIAVLDHMSGGRLEVTVALGYRPEEFSAFGFTSRQRVSRMEEGLDILKLAFSGEPFSYSGRHYNLHDLVVRPEPYQRPHPPLWIGAMTPPAAARAGRFGAHLRGGSLDQEFFDAYIQGLAESGVALASRRISKSISFTVTEEDPDQVWSRNREFYARRWGFYEQIQRAIGDPVIKSGLGIPEMEAFRDHELIGTPEAVLSTLAGVLMDTPVTDVIYSGLASGIPVTEGLDSLHLFAEQVMPALRSW